MQVLVSVLALLLPATRLPRHRLDSPANLALTFSSRKRFTVTTVRMPINSSSRISSFLSGPPSLRSVDTVVYRFASLVPTVEVHLVKGSSRSPRLLFSQLACHELFRSIHQTLLLGCAARHVHDQESCTWFLFLDFVGFLNTFRTLFGLHRHIFNFL